MHKKPLILLVEDNLNDIELVKLALSSQIIPNDIVVVQDGEEALKWLLSDDQSLPDLVLLDLHLPKVNGLEVLQKLRQHERTKKLPVIIFTSSQEQADRARGYQLGANAFIQKTIDPNEFKTALKNLDIYWLVKSA